MASTLTGEAEQDIWSKFYPNESQKNLIVNIQLNQTCVLRIESLLLKQRWSLIQSGVDRKDIRLSYNCLFVKRKLHGEVRGAVFVQMSELTQFPPSLSSEESKSDHSALEAVQDEQAHTGTVVDNSQSTTVWLPDPIQLCLLNSRSLVNKLKHSSSLLHSKWLPLPKHGWQINLQ